MKILMFGASLRASSYNRKLAINAARLWSDHFANDQVDRAEFREFEMPVYDGDLEDRSGIPAGAEALVKRIASAEAVVISTPEYNGGMPGALKNAIDWVSRADKNPLVKKPLLLIATSPGALGGIRSLWHSRVPLEAIGARVYPTMFAAPKAGAIFAADDRLHDAPTAERLAKLLCEFREFAEKLGN